MAKTPIEQMTDHEMLVELLEEKRLRDKLRLIKLIGWGVVAIVLVVLAVIYVPPMVRFFKEVHDNIDSISKSLESLNETVTDAYGNITEVSDSIKEQLENLKSLENLIPGNWFGR